MRRGFELSADAVAVLLFISRQRLRLYQDIPFSEVRDALHYHGERLAAAFSECVQGGWLLVDRPRGREPHYSMVATGRRRVARLVPKLN